MAKVGSRRAKVGMMALRAAVLSAMAPEALLSSGKTSAPRKPRAKKKGPMKTPSLRRQAVGVVGRFMVPYTSLLVRRPGEGRPSNTYRWARREWMGTPA